MDVLHRLKGPRLRLTALTALCALAITVPRVSRAQQAPAATGWRVNTY